MEPKYYETARVVQVNLWKAQLPSPVEGNVQLALRNRFRNDELTVDCFVYQELEKWRDVNTGDSILSELVLLNWQYDQQAEAKTSIERIKGYEYRVNGKIVELSPDIGHEDSLFVVLDCGVYVETRVGKNHGLKVGDYLNAEGRLDAHIVEKVK